MNWLQKIRKKRTVRSIKLVMRAESAEIKKCRKIERSVEMNSFIRCTEFERSIRKVIRLIEVFFLE